MKVTNSGLKTRKKCRHNNRKRRSKLILNIVGDASVKSTEMNTMQNSRKYNIDILQKTRRVIVNDMFNQGQRPKLLDNNILNIPSSSVVKFSNTLLTRPEIPVSNTTCSTALSVQNTNTFHNRGRYFDNGYRMINRVKRPNSEDEVVYIETTNAIDNSILSGNLLNSSCVTINDVKDLDDSIITIDSPTSTPDLSKFSIVVTNTSQPQDSNKDEDIICIDSDTTGMEGIEADNTTAPCTENTGVDSNCSVIVIDDSTTDPATLKLPKRQLNIPKRKIRNLICRKKDRRKFAARIPIRCPKSLELPDTVLGKERILETTKLACDVSNLKRNNLNSTKRERITFNLDDLSKKDGFESGVAISTRKPIDLSDLSPSPKQTSNGNSNTSTIYNSGPVSKSGLREIIIDGSNVALGHSNGADYSIEGIQIVVDYFVKRGHKVRAFVPQFRVLPGRSTNPELLRQLVKDKYVILTPSRAVSGRRITPYDDRYIVQYATTCEGIIVSSDCYRDLLHEHPEWRYTIENRLLMPTWIDNVLMFPDDPLGRYGPNLTEFLSFPNS